MTKQYLRHSLAYLLFLLIATVITYPMITTFSTHYAGHAFSDSYEMIRHIWWMRHALENGYDIFFQPLLVYPQGLDGALLWSFPLQSFPAWLFAFFMPLPAAFNLMILLRLALNGWACYWLVRHLTGGKVLPALVAGVIFTAYPSFQGHVAAGHVGLLALWAFPFYVYALCRYYETRRRGWMGAAIAFFVVSGWGSTQLLLFTTLPFTGVLALALIVQRTWRRLRALSVIVVIGAAIALIFALPLINATRQLDDVAHSPQKPFDTIAYSADALAIFTPSPYHPLLATELSGAILGIDPFEQSAYIGMIAAALALIGLGARHAIFSPKLWLAFAALAWLFSLGGLLHVGGELFTLETDGYLSYVPLPWGALQNLPIINITRTPVRFNFAVALSVAVLAGYGVQWLSARVSRRWLGALVALCIVGIVYEYHVWWSPEGNPDLPMINGVVPDEIAALREDTSIRAILDLPIELAPSQKGGLWLQTAHHHALISGYMTRGILVNLAKLQLLQHTLDPALLAHEGADIVILHKEWDTPELDALTRERMDAPIYEDDDFAVFRVPALTPPLSFLTTTQIEPDRAALYAFVPPDALERALLFRAEMTAPEGVSAHTLTLEHNGVVIARWENQVTYDIEIEIALDGTGYHTLTLVSQPECSPAPMLDYLTCPSVDFRVLSAELAL